MTGCRHDPPVTDAASPPGEAADGLLAATPAWGLAAYRHFTVEPARDPIMAALAARHGVIHFVPETDVFGRLVKAIVGQQISGKAANAIRGRIAALSGDPPTPHALAALPDEALRGCGLSANKLRAIRDLTDHALDGRLDLRRLPTLPDEEIVGRLTAVRGIGRWTAEMLLLFGLGRPDVLPVDDLGVRIGIQRAYGLSTQPKPAQLREMAQPWRPYASAAAYYLWRSLDA